MHTKRCFSCGCNCFSKAVRRFECNIQHTLLRFLLLFLFSPSPKLGGSKTDRLQFLSPAAQSLASKKLGIRVNSDKALQASYTPSPSTSRTPGDKTPSLISSSPGSSSVRSTKGGATPDSSKTTPKRAVKHPSASASITDNLLNLPKRAKAQEFF